MKHTPFFLTLLLLAALSSPGFAQKKLIDDVRRAYPDESEYVLLKGAMLEKGKDYLKSLDEDLIPQGAKLEEVSTLLLNDKGGAEYLANQLPSLTEKEGYEVNMAVQMKGEIIFILSKSEPLKDAPGYRYRNHYIVYNQDGPEAQLVWCVFLSADKPEGMKTEEPQ